MSFVKFISESSFAFTVLNDTQSTYKADKPLLGSRFVEARGAGFGGLVDFLENMLTNPDTGEIDPNFQQYLDTHRAITDMLDTEFADPAMRIMYKQGIMDTAVQNVVGPARDQIIETINMYMGQIDDPNTPPIVVAQLQGGVQLFSMFLSVQLSILWYVINYDYQDTDIDNDQLWGDFFSTYTSFLSPLVNRTEMRVLFMQQAMYRGKFKDKPMLDNKVRAMFPNSIYEIHPSKNVAAYAAGDIVADLHIFAAGLVKAWAYKGCVPQGMHLDEATGQISVTDPTVLSPGTYCEIMIQVDDLFGDNSVHTIDLVILEDIEAVYTVFPARPVGNYVADDSLAKPADQDAEIVSACIASGKLPAGSKFSTSSGTVSVADPLKLVPGSYALSILTRDETGGTTTSDIVIDLLE